MGNIVVLFRKKLLYNGHDGENFARAFVQATKRLFPKYMAKTHPSVKITNLPIILIVRRISTCGESFFSRQI